MGTIKMNRNQTFSSARHDFKTLSTTNFVVRRGLVIDGVFGQSFCVHWVAEVIAKRQMIASNPYQPPSAESETRSLKPIDLFVVGIWLALPVGVFAGRQVLRPVFEEFELELPMVSLYLLDVYSLFALAIISLAVSVAIFMIPNGSAGRRFILLSGVSGVLFGMVCAFSMIGPMVSLLWALN